MTGAISGMDIAEALAALNPGLNREFAVMLLSAAERSFIAAYVEVNLEAEKSDGNGK